MGKKITKFEPVIFQQKEIRRIWFKKQWFFSVLDVVEVLTDSPVPKTYWAKMKSRDQGLNQLFPFWEQLKLKASDGKKYLTDCSNEQGILRIIQSIPSKKAEPFKLWLAKVGKERIEEIRDPELAMARMKAIYRAKGYPDEWIEKRARGIAIRNELTDEWQNRGVSHSMEFALLTNEIMTGTFDMKVADYKKLKKLKKENLRDHMDDMELIFTMLTEATTTRISRKKKVRKMSKDKEIEIQVQIENSRRLMVFLEKEAEFVGEKRQMDRYFTPAHRKFPQVRPVKEWLRLRNSEGKFWINYKNWHYDKDVKSHYCDEYETVIEDLGQMEKIFKALDMKEVVTVDKVRKIYNYGDYEIAIDTVNGLGDFVEIEFKRKVNKDPAEVTQEMVGWLKNIGVGKITRNYVGYPFQLLFPEETKEENL